MGYFGIPFRNGVPIGLGSVASFGAQQFDPSSLFIGGTVGTFYDPSDPTTLFTTSTGTTPCAVPGSGSQVLVGLMLDKSQGAPGALGAELVTNGTFDANINGWTAQFTSTASWQAGALRSVSSGTNAGEASTPITCVVGRTYRVTGIVLGGTSTGRITASSSTFGGSGGAYTASGTQTFYFVATATTMYVVCGNGSGANGVYCDYDNISVRELAGNHAIAFNDTTARPELSARVNLVTYSEEFDNGAWLKTGLTVTANTQIAPNGTLTADTLTASVGVGFHYISAPTATQAASYTYTICVKKGTSSWIFFGILDSRLNYFNLDTGLFGSVTDTCVAQNLGNGWYRLTATGTVTVGSAGGTNIGLASGNGGGNFVAAGTETVHIWGSDFRFSNIGSAIPSYQRIADQYTYDSNGFPSYLRFDGVDDSMYTPASINFSGTDKMSVFAGVRKLSDAAVGMFAELSAAAAINNGSFYVAAPESTGASGNYTFLCGGTAGLTSISSGTLLAPNTSVLTGIGEISTDTKLLRINGAQVASSAGDQGTGNFGTYPLYIGSRNNASLRFNGHLYSLIVAGTQLQSGSITATEQYVAGKTGVQL